MFGFRFRLAEPTTTTLRRCRKRESLNQYLNICGRKTNKKKQKTTAFRWIRSAQGLLPPRCFPRRVLQTEPVGGPFSIFGKTKKKKQNQINVSCGSSVHRRSDFIGVPQQKLAKGQQKKKERGLLVPHSPPLVRQTLKLPTFMFHRRRHWQW